MTRRADGTYVRWTTRRVSVGRGEGVEPARVRLGDLAQAAAELPLTVIIYSRT